MTLVIVTRASFRLARLVAFVFAPPSPFVTSLVGGIASPSFVVGSSQTDTAVVVLFCGVQLKLCRI